MQPVVGMDVSKGRSEGQAFLDRRNPFGKPFQFEHTQAGLQRLRMCLREVEKRAGKRPWVILEATGHYHLPVTTFLEQHGYPAVVVNPLTSQRSKRSHLRKVKTDAQDAFHLAELFYKEDSRPLQDSLSRLRLLTRHHEAMTSAYVQLKLQFQAILDQVFPLFPGIFSDLFCKTSLKMLHRYPTPSAVLEAGEEELVAEVHSLSSRSEAWAKEKAKKMMTAAQNSPVMAVCESHRVLLREMMELLSRHQEHLKRIEKEMETLAREMDEYDLLRSIPGVGDKIAATILSEMGEVDRFDHAKKLVAFAGLDPSVYVSGKFVSTTNRITKRGSKRLRRALFLAVQCGIRGKRNRCLRKFYDQKRLEGKPHKVAMIACANKLLRIIYALLTRKEAYREANLTG